MAETDDVEAGSIFHGRGRDGEDQPLVPVRTNPPFLDDQLRSHRRSRAVNELMRRLAIDRVDEAEWTPWICECARPACVKTVWLSRSEYDEVRGRTAHFALFPGHQLPDEHVVRASNRFAVVRVPQVDGNGGPLTAESEASAASGLAGCGRRGNSEDIIPTKSS